MRKFEFVRAECRKGGMDKLPTRSTKYAAAYDFYSPLYAIVEPHKSIMIWTNVKAQMEHDEVLLINVRSSMGKQPVMIANTQGWIDSDYYGNESNDGNIGVRLYNLGDTPYEIKTGDRIAQGMFVKYLITDDDEGNGAVRTGGIGSTGV